MKKIAAEYCIRAVDSFRPGNKAAFTIYGDDTTYNFLEELAQHLSSINQNLLFTVEHLYAEEPEPFVMLAFFDGKECGISDEDGSYFVIDCDAIYKIVDTDDGLRLAFESCDIYSDL